MKDETEFERRLREILTEYPGIDPERAALALKNDPEATNEHIVRLSKFHGELPPYLTWEDIENGKPGQLMLFFSGVPTVAERAFLVLARKWLVDVQAVGRNIRLPRAFDVLALSCLLLAVEWGSEFTGVAQEQMETNRKEAATRRDMPPGGRGWVLEPNPSRKTAVALSDVSWDVSWDDQLSWELCQVPSIMVAPSETIEVEKLTVNLDHHNSSIRYWMMEIGWMARPWLTGPEAMPRLLKNLADTLGGPFMAAGLAAALVSTVDEFWTLARGFKPNDDRFAEQYADRLKYVKDHGILEMQTPFWNLEAQCRKMIADAVLGLRLVAPRSQQGSPAFR
jgi:hypothetical protein